MTNEEIAELIYQGRLADAAAAVHQSLLGLLAVLPPQRTHVDKAVALATSYPSTTTLLRAMAMIEQLRRNPTSTLDQLNEAGGSPGSVLPKKVIDRAGQRSPLAALKDAAREPAVAALGAGVVGLIVGVYVGRRR